MNHLLIFTIAISAFISGCSTTPVSPSTQKQQPIEVKKKPICKEEVKSSLPNWILNPNKNGFICDIGSSRVNAKMSTTKKVALITAKARISEQVKLYINTQSNSEASCINDECKKEFHTKTNIQSSNMIKNIRTLNDYTDVLNNIYYVQVCTKI
jgi:hypothetical protein